MKFGLCLQIHIYLDLCALYLISTDDEYLIPTCYLLRGLCCGVSILIERVAAIELPTLLDYFMHSNPGLHNLLNNIPIFLLVRKLSCLLLPRRFKSSLLF